MKKIFVAALAVGSVFSGGAAFAAQTEDIQARIDAIEKENAAIRRENAALQQNRSLRERNDALKSSTAQPRAVAQPVVLSEPAPAAVSVAKPKSVTDKMADLFGAYAADLPVAYKARPPTPGLLRFWGEGGAILTGGDPVSRDFNLIDFTSLGGLFTGGGFPHHFDLTPKIGWEVATGFDYRFANSPWHISGQFRYGEGGKTSGSASSAGQIDPAALVLIGAPPGFNFGGSEAVGVSHKEYHWLADLTAGYDVLGHGPDAMQVKGGLRVTEFVGKTNSSDLQNFFLTVPPPGLGGITNFSFASNSVTNDRNSFLGAGPVIGLQGSVPFAGKWTFDYLGDAGVLFGTQKFVSTNITTTSGVPAFIFNGLGSNASTFSNERFATAFSADIQVGFGYWVTPNVKVAGSYRLDALIFVQNQDTSPVTNLAPNRYTHGPRVTVSGQFASN
jgi:hypothetical protein